MNQSTTGASGNTTTVSLEEMVAAMRHADLIPKPQTWTLITPDGRVYQGKYEDVAPVFMSFHPLLQKSPPAW